jgi:2'-5' RNA ligase
MKRQWEGQPQKPIAILDLLYNKPMRTTSHFVGALVSSEQFVDLFVKLQGYFKDHKLDDVVELQGILSLHITLYYLGDHLDVNEKNRLIDDAVRLSPSPSAIPTLEVGYFGKPAKPRVCYVGCPPNAKLSEINQFFTTKYDHANITENQLEFVPHISLFRISDPNIYEPHRIAVDKLISDALQTIEYGNLIEGTYLFQVNSLFHPEIQVAIR